MSTSMMLIVKKDSNIKIAQYGSYDGSPLSQGANIFKSLKSIDINAFKLKLDKCYFLEGKEEEIMRDAFNKPPSQTNIEIPISIMEEASSIIEWIDISDEKIVLLNDIKYIDGCNYIYMVDFDSDKFKIYYNDFSKEFNEDYLEIGNLKYKSCKQIVQFDLFNLAFWNEYYNKLHQA